MPDPLRRKLLIVSGVVLVLLFAGFYAAAHFKGPFYRRNLMISVDNVGDQELRDVTVHVAGEALSLGRLLPGRDASVAVWPLAESGIRVTFTSLDGRQQDFDAGRAVRPQLVGRILVELNADRIVAVEADTYPR